MCLKSSGSRRASLVDRCGENLKQKTLELDFEAYDGCGYTDYEIVLEALKNNSTITNLELSHFKERELHKQFAHVALCNQSIAKLHLQCNGIDSNGCIAIANALKTNKTTTKLDVSMNEIKNEGVIALADCLRTKATLTKLTLRGNNIGNYGGIAIASILSTNESLGSIDLARNRLGDEVAIQFASALVRNKRFSFLRLSSNHIGNDGCKAVVGALQTCNTTLRGCDLSDNQQIDAIHLDKLKQYLDSLVSS